MFTSTENEKPRRWYHLSLTQQIMIGLLVGVLLGWWINQQSAPDQEDWNKWLAVVRDIFLHLIKAMIAPLIFASGVQGFAGTGDVIKARRIGV